ncbi:efflux RND transporter permease subunit [Chloroflexia bacterium SDU3-3]|nr:efflux RND transporter permease subunit [Chloroflexia bacterium SDU3-3]
MSTPANKKYTLNGNAVADFSIREPILILIAMAAIVTLGIAAFIRLPLSLLPPSNEPTIVVLVSYPGASPQTMTDEVVKPIEDQIATLDDVDKVIARSQQGMTAIITQFKIGVDLNAKQQTLREKVNLARLGMPLGVLEPNYQQYDQNQQPILVLALSSSGDRTPENLHQLLKDTITPEIQTADGVAGVIMVGGRERQINVELSLEKLQALRIQPAEVDMSIAAASPSLSLGDATANGLDYRLSTPGAFSTPQDIANVPLSLGDYRVGDVATIVDSHAPIDTYTRLNGTDSVVMLIQRESTANTDDAAKAAMAKLNTALAAYPDVHYTIVQDQAEEVKQNVDGALEDVAIAVVFAVLVVWLFFRDIRHTVVTVFGMPIIIAGTFICMYALGLTLNIVTLLALSVSVGLVIDDAIVVRENVFRNLELGYPPMLAASRGAAQVVGSVVGMTLTIIVVFLPSINTPGVPGMIFTAFSVVVISAMAVSLFEAFTSGSVVSALWLKPAKGVPPIETMDGEDDVTKEHIQDTRLNRVYRRALVWSLHHRGLVMLGTALILVLTVVLSIGVRYTFLPLDQNNQVGISFQMEPGTPLDTTDQQARQVEQILRDTPNVKNVLTVVGSLEGKEHAFFFVTYTGKQKVEAFEDALRPKLAGLPRLAFSLTNYESSAITDVLVRPIQVQIRSQGLSHAQLEPYASQLRAAFAKVEGLGDLDSSYTPGVPALEYRIKPEEASRYGITNATLGLTMQTLVNGTTVGRYREDGHAYNISVRLREQDRQSVDAISTLRIPTGKDLVPLSSIATIQPTAEPLYTLRADRTNEILLSGNNVGRNMNQVIADMQQVIAQNPPPAGVDVTFGGFTFNQQQQGYSSLINTIVISILLIYLVLACIFRSLSQPLVLMLAMPLSLIGAVVAIRICNLEVNIVTMVGLQMLLGLVVKNSIMLMEYTNKLREAGMSTYDALIKAGQVRMRPILMTSAAIMSGNIPTVMGLGAGADLRQGLGIVIVGGMISSTVLTLLVVPAAYSVYESAVELFGKKFHRHGDEAAISEQSIQQA